MGVAPADAPKLVIVVRVDEAQRPAHTGGATAAPLFARIAAAQLTRYGIFTEPERSRAQPRPTVAAWDVTGVSEPDCLSCHRKDRSVDVPTQKDNNTSWRQVTLRGMTSLVDSGGASVPAYAAAATAGQGWWSTLTQAGSPPTASVLQIDYSEGVADGSLLEVGGTLQFNGENLIETPVDFACWGCHAFPDGKKRGRVWFDETEDIHYGYFSNLNDADPTNDIPPEESQGCTACHPSEIDHDFDKGNSFAGSVRNSTDYSVTTCRDCHLASSPLKHPDAPEPTSAIHQEQKHLDTMSCTLCHSPFKTKAADLVVDNSVTGSGVGYTTAEFLSSDPQDPTNPDKTSWYPALEWKTDKDGVDRLFPAKTLNTVWWGNWDDNGTPGNTTDDVIEPTILWRLRQLTAGNPIAGAADDNGDGKAELNTDAEILAAIAAIEAFNDSYGNPLVADKAILIRGGYAWYEDAGALASFELHGSGIKAESWVPFSIDHNIRSSTEALGAGGDCGACHGGAGTDVFDRSVLVDPWDPTAAPVYDTPRNLTGVSPL